jgi:HPt (histidine-containing phosphotransfer) domain-containing protein
MASDPPIVWASLDQLADEVGQAVLPRLLRTFFAEAETRLGAFARLSQEGAEIGEGGQLHREIHSLKSAAASFGAAALAMRAAEIEDAIETGTYRHDPKDLAALAGMIAAFRDAVKRRGIAVD